MKASPIAKRLAAEYGIYLTTVRGTGPGGRITRDDVLAAKDALGEASQEPAPESGIPGTTIEITRIKKLVGERMRQSYLDAPHIHLSTTCDMSDVVRLREELNSRAQDGPRITLTDTLLWSVSRALEKHQLLNATIKGNSIILLDEINIGVAVATDKGLIVPNIRQVNSLSLTQIAKARETLVERAKDGKQTPDDLVGGTFTVTNLGMFDVDFFDPIVTPGQSAILATGRIRQELSLSDAGEVVQVSPRVRRIVEDNPGPFTFTGTCTYIVGRGEVAVIDPGRENESHIAAILAALKGERIAHIVVSHTHLDHSPGARRLGEPGLHYRRGPALSEPARPRTASSGSRSPPGSARAAAHAGRTRACGAAGRRRWRRYGRVRPRRHRSRGGGR